MKYRVHSSHRLIDVHIRFLLSLSLSLSLSFSVSLPYSLLAARRCESLHWSDSFLGCHRVACEYWVTKRQILWRNQSFGNRSETIQLERSQTYLGRPEFVFTQVFISFAFAIGYLELDLMWFKWNRNWRETNGFHVMHVPLRHVHDWNGRCHDRGNWCVVIGIPQLSTSTWMYWIRIENQANDSNDAPTVNRMTHR